MIARISSTMRKMFLPPGFSPRCSRRTANQPMQMKIIDVTTLGTMSNQSGPCDGAASGYAVANRIARATMYQNGFVLWGGTFGSRGMTTSNENKMSDGGRGRASLGVEVVKSSQNWSAQRSGVRSIAWLDGGRRIANTLADAEDRIHDVL